MEVVVSRGRLCVSVYVNRAEFFTCSLSLRTYCSQNVSGLACLILMRWRTLEHACADVRCAC